MGQLYSSSDISILLDKCIAIVGYGSQGVAQAMNIKDHGFNVRIALREGSTNIAKAQSDGFEVMSIVDAAKWADIMVMLIPDDIHGEVYDSFIRNNLKKHGTLIFAHGLSVGFGYLHSDLQHNTCLSAPKAVGPAVREKFVAGISVPCFVGVDNDASGDALQIAEAYSVAIAGGRILVHSKLKEEAESDLFGEQVVLCGGVPSLLRMAYDILVSSGTSPEVAYFECVYELKLIVDLIERHGLCGMMEKISNTAEYGGLVVGKNIVNDAVRNCMQDVLHNIKNGVFNESMFAEVKNGWKSLITEREAVSAEQIETVGKKVRQLLYDDGLKSLDVYSEFLNSSALLQGHFLLSSGKHSAFYIQCAKIFEYPDRAKKLCKLLVEKARKLHPELINSATAIVAPAMGAVIMGYEMSSILGIRGIFCERVGGVFILRRSFSLSASDRIIIIEDVLTTGKSSVEVYECIKESGAEVILECVLVQRGELVNIPFPIVSLLKLDIPIYDGSDVPDELRAIPIEDLGSRRLKG